MADAKWPGDQSPDGYPCCYLVMTVKDMMGYGFPSGGLPKYLFGFGLNGWKVVEKDEKLDLEPGGITQTHEEGCRDYLELHEQAIRQQLELWKAYEAWIAGQKEVVTPQKTEKCDENHVTKTKRVTPRQEPIHPAPARAKKKCSNT